MTVELHESASGAIVAVAVGVRLGAVMPVARGWRWWLGDCYGGTVTTPEEARSALVSALAGMGCVVRVVGGEG